MSDQADQSSQRWYGAKPSGVRLFAALVMSLALHLALLLLQFGEYGEGLPGFELPLGDRRAHSPELHLNLQPSSPPPVISPRAPSPNPLELPPAEVNTPKVVDAPSGFEVVPLPVEHLVPQIIKPVEPDTAVHTSRSKPELITSTKANSEFKVAQPEPVKDDPVVVQAEAPMESKAAEEVPEVPVLPAEAEGNKEKAVLDKLAEERALQAHEAEQVQKQLVEKQQADAQKELEQKQEQLAAVQNEKLKQEALARQQAERDKVELANLLAEQEQAEQRKVLDALREQKALLVKAQLERERLEQALAEKKQLEIERLKQDQLKQEQNRQEQIKQEQQARLLAEQTAAQQAAQLKQQELDRQLQLSRAEAQRQADAQAKAQARADQSRQRSTDLDELLGARSDHGNGGGAKPDMEKMLSGRSADFDRTGEALGSSIGTSVPAPKAAATTSVRQSIFGSKNSDVDLSLYIKSWRQKIEGNGRLNFSQSAKDRMHTDPVVTVSIRSDGSVESVTILRSSGVAEMDEAVRRIVRINAPYSVFPPLLARKFDVIDIRQVWIFDAALHVTDELR